jgi:hypothetical protein
MSEQHLNLFPLPARVGQSSVPASDLARSHAHREILRQGVLGEHVGLDRSRTTRPIKDRPAVVHFAGVKCRERSPGLHTSRGPGGRADIRSGGITLPNATVYAPGCAPGKKVRKGVSHGGRVPPKRDLTFGNENAQWLNHR